VAKPPPSEVPREQAQLRRDRRVLREAPGVIRALVEDNRALEEKVAHKERRERVEKIASAMHEKGIHIDVPHTSLADQLEKDASEGKSLDVIEHAVDLVSPDMGAKFAQLDTEGSAPAGISNVFWSGAWASGPGALIWRRFNELIRTRHGRSADSEARLSARRPHTRAASQCPRAHRWRVDDAEYQLSARAGFGHSQRRRTGAGAEFSFICRARTV